MSINWVKKNGVSSESNVNSVTFIKLPEAKVLEGSFIETKHGEGNYGPFVTHYFETESGKVGVNGFAALNRELENVEPGSLVKVDYLGKKTSKAGRSYHAIDFFVAE